MAVNRRTGTRENGSKQLTWVTEDLGEVVGVTHTIKVLTASQQQIRVRLAFIDAPEKGQAFGQRAKQAMSDLVFGKDVELVPHAIDRYGRLVAVVYVDGTDAGLALLKAGLCWVYERYVREASPEIQARYRDAQELAQTQKAGLWQDPDPVPPWEWRKAKKVQVSLQLAVEEHPGAMNIPQSHR